jgi:hypothetical protein
VAGPFRAMPSSAEFMMKTPLVLLICALLSACGKD